MYPGGLEPIPCGYMSDRKPNAQGKKINSALIKKTNLSQINTITLKSDLPSSGVSVEWEAQCVLGS